MKPFLILQARPETDAADDEYGAFLAKGGLRAEQTHRIRLDQQDIPYDLSLDEYSGVIVGGGPGCVSDLGVAKSPVEKRIETSALGLMPEITKRDFPFMGCCYGIGILAHHLGADVSKEKYGENVGAVNCTTTAQGENDPILQDVPTEFLAFVGHKEAAQNLPDGCVHLVSSSTCPYQMIRFKQNVYATQFHPEADSAGFAARVEIYKHRGYFPPDEAENLIAMCHAQQVDMPERILRNFVNVYGLPNRNG
ncbi:MAG: GMP synthase (glutamine-hydrolyzing) [Planctomycetota bacterium]|jgi:GMP synthase (glutamine-hydrolysing)